MKSHHTSPTVHTLNSIFRHSQDRIVAMVKLLAADPSLPPKFQDSSSAHRTAAISERPLRCVAVLAVVASTHASLSSKPPPHNTVHSWVALAEGSRRQFFSVFLHRAPVGDDWVIASIMRGRTAKKLRRVVAGTAREGAKPWLISVPNLRVLCLFRAREDRPARIQVLQKGLSSLQEGGLYGLKSFQSRLATDELRFSHKLQKLRDIESPRRGLQ